MSESIKSDAADSQLRPGSIASIFLLFTAPFVFLFVVSGTDTSTLVRFFPDDAFYYLQIGANLWQHGIASFDGINVTTGFHPLNQLLAALAVGGFGKQGALLFYLLFNALALAIALCLVADGLKWSVRDTRIAAAVLLLPVFNLHLITSSGMESALMLICFAGLLRVLLRQRDWSATGSRDAVLVGMWVGLLLLARLDMVVPLTPVGLLVAAEVVRANRRAAVAWLVLCMVTAALVMLPYLVWMLIEQGSLMPVSSVAKYGRPHWPLATVWQALTSGRMIGTALLLTYLLVPPAIAVLARRALNEPVGRLMIVVGLSGVLMLLYVIGIAHESFKWYLNYPAFACFVTTLWFVTSLPRLRSLPESAAMWAQVVAVVVCALFLHSWANTESTSLQLYRLTGDLNRRLPRGSVIATNDAGTLGYFSTSTVHNLDGLVNSLANYRQYLATGDYNGYAAKYHVDYLLIREELYPAMAQRWSGQNGGVAAPAVIETFDIPRFGREVLVRLR